MKEHISSVHMLQVLLFLHANQGKSFSCEDVLAEVRSSHSAARECLLQLVAAGLVQSTETAEPRYQFRPIRDQAADTVHELAKHFAERSTAVIQLIYSQRG